jgi:hypothetical protein
MRLVALGALIWVALSIIIAPLVGRCFRVAADSWVERAAPISSASFAQSQRALDEGVHGPDDSVEALQDNVLSPSFQPERL